VTLLMSNVFASCMRAAVVHITYNSEQVSKKNDYNVQNDDVSVHEQ